MSYTKLSPGPDDGGKPCAELETDRNCDTKGQHSGTACGRGLFGAQQGPGFDGDTAGPAAAWSVFPSQVAVLWNQVPFSAPSTQAGHNCVGGRAGWGHSWMGLHSWLRVWHIAALLCPSPCPSPRPQHSRRQQQAGSRTVGLHWEQGQAGNELQQEQAPSTCPRTPSSPCQPSLPTPAPAMRRHLPVPAPGDANTRHSPDTLEH